jgi:GDPmannose 4,6-dehydratase
MSKRALITGATGFAGPCLAKRLLELGYEVYVLFRRKADGIQPRRLVQEGVIGEVKMLDGDITDLTSILFALNKSQPEVIFHLASQSYIPRSFHDPLETFRINSLGTQNLLEAVRLKDIDCKIIFAGSSEEYGLQIVSEKHYKWALEKYGIIFPEPERIPELPVQENNPLRPMSPYAVSKINGDFLMRNYYHAYGLETIVSRAFNHEGAGRGPEFVTSTIARQCVRLKLGESSHIIIGNVNVFRDWSHIEDIVQGYILLAEKGRHGDAYIQGSMRTNTVLTYILLGLQYCGYEINEIETLKGDKRIRHPAELSDEEFFGVKFKKTNVDSLILKNEIEYTISDEGLRIRTNKGDVVIKFDPERFRPAEVPILMSNVKKIQGLGYEITKSLEDIIEDQMNYYLNPENRIV